MKNIFKTLSLLLATSVLFYSCSDDDNTGASMVNYISPTVTLSTASTNVVVDESAIDPATGHAITITASIPEAVTANLYVYLEQTGGTADSNDYSFDGVIEIKAGNTSGSANVTIWQDCESGVEGDETLTIGYVGPTANANVSPFSLNISIENDWVNDALEVSVTWEGTYTYDASYGEVTLNFCDIDMDTILLDGAGNLIDYIAGTSACTEVGELTGLADGTYYVLVDMYENPLTGAGNLGLDIPLTTSWSQCGFPDTAGSFETLGFTSNVGPVSNPHAIGEVAVIVATIELTGGYNYTVSPF